MTTVTVGGRADVRRRARHEPGPALLDAPRPVHGVDVIVVVVTWNSAGLLADLLASLRRGLEGLSWELFVADNDSRDGTLSVLGEVAPEAAVVRMGRNAGYAAGINAAVSAAAGAGLSGPVLILNPDVRLDVACVPELLRAVRAGAGIAVPRLVDGHDELILSMRRTPTVLGAVADAFLGTRRSDKWFALGEVVADVDRYERSGSPDWAEGSTQLVSAECAAACAGWDEEFFLYSEETDFHLRAKDAGFTVCYVPSARAVHLGGQSTVSPDLWALLVANRVKLFRKRRDRLSTFAYWLVLLVRESSRALLGRPTSQRAVRVLLDPRRLSAPRGPGWAR